MSLDSVKNEKCLFCKIVLGDIPASKVFENDQVLAFNDIYPQAPIHILFIHKKHSHNIINLLDSQNSQQNELFEIFNAIKDYAKKHNIDQSGFRIINNCGEDGGQTIFHTHFHLLAGKKLPW